MRADLNVATHEPYLRRRAGDLVYNRGQAAYEQGRVKSFEYKDWVVRCVVRGERDHAVSLTTEDGKLKFSCDCQPGARRPVFCEHCVAAAVAWHRSRMDTQKEIKPRKALPLPELGDKDEFIRAVLDWAREDAALRDRIAAYQQTRLTPDTRLETARTNARKALRVRNSPPGAWAQAMFAALDALAPLAEAGHAEAVMDVLEDLRVELAYSEIHDSGDDGYHVRQRIKQVFFETLQKARPDPVKLARRIFEGYVFKEVDFYYECPTPFVEHLGEEGMKEFRRLAEAEWAKAAPRTSKDRRRSVSDWRRHITGVMEQLARISGDLDELVAVRSRDLSSYWEYMQIAKLYDEAGRHDDALAWCERGLQALPQGAKRVLQEHVAEKYEALGRYEEATELMWGAFCERPEAHQYEKLCWLASKGVNCDQWRQRALDMMRLLVADKKVSNAELVRILLNDGDVEAAWNQARLGGCPRDLMSDVAMARAESYPEEAVGLIWNQVQEDLAKTDYDRAVLTLLNLGDVMKCLGRGHEFALQLEALKEKYKSKWRFINLLDEYQQDLDPDADDGPLAIES